MLDVILLTLISVFIIAGFIYLIIHNDIEKDNERLRKISEFHYKCFMQELRMKREMNKKYYRGLYG